jgi:hypothetical protein
VSGIGLDIVSLTGKMSTKPDQAQLAIGWHIVEVTPDERTLLAAHGVAIAS